MNHQSLLVRLGLVGVCLTLLGCQKPGSLELVWSVRQGLVGQWGIHGDEVFTVGRYLGVYDLSTGRESRRVRLPQDYANITLGQIGPEVTIDDSNLVFGWYDFGREEGKEGKIFCYDPKTLALRWERAFEWRWDARSTRPTFSVVIDGSHLYALAIGKEGENLFKLRLSDGKMVWARSVEKFVQGVPAVLYQGKLLVRSTVSLWAQKAYGYYQAINPETGAALWRIRIDGDSVFAGEPLISGGRAYLISTMPLSEPAHLYVVAISTGEVLAHVRIRSAGGTPFAEDGRKLYLVGTEPTALALGTWQPVWQTILNDPQSLGPSVGVFDRIQEELYLGDSEKNLYILSSETGAMKGKVYIRGYWRGEFFSPLKAFFGSYGVERSQLNRGLLFVGTVDKSLFVFRRTEKM